MKSSQAVVDMLNVAIAADPAVMSNVLQCMAQLGPDNPIVAQKLLMTAKVSYAASDSTYFLRPIGLLNSALMQLGYQRIALKLDADTGIVVGAQVAPFDVVTDDEEPPKYVDPNTVGDA